MNARLAEMLREVAKKKDPPPKSVRTTLSLTDDIVAAMHDPAYEHINWSQVAREAFSKVLGLKTNPSCQEQIDELKERVKTLEGRTKA